MCVAFPARMATTEHIQRRITLLDLLNELMAEGPHSEQALVARVLEMVRSGNVVLCGNYANKSGRRFGLD